MHERNDACPRMLQYRPPRIAMTLLLSALALQLLLPSLWPALPSSAAVGALAGAIGLAVMLRAWWLFRRHDSAILPKAETSTLIVGDVYAYTRNPMYLGIVLMLLGVAIATGGIAYYIATVAYFLIIDYAFCSYEEQKLEHSFGDEYVAYCRGVRRWL